MERSLNEDEWVSLARLILDAGRSDFVKVFSMQVYPPRVHKSDSDIQSSQKVSISPLSLLPTFRGTYIQPRRVDLALAFTDVNAKISAAYAHARDIIPDVAFSQTMDAGIAEMALFAHVEIKSPAGEYFGASVQLGTWVAAGLEKLWRLAEDLSETGYDCARLWPVPCWTVVGHAWNLHLAYKEGDQSVIVLGPFPCGGTASPTEILLLLDAVQRVMDYAERYWQWLEREIFCVPVP
ncbi:MAG: hypothetical protein M1832_006414 [Thelocarpon impressellum]|nr:MAG: hypothetical protein M1832_006414 [Thelocarpon impressellum]